MNVDAFRHLYNYHFTENRAIWDKYLIQYPELASRVRGIAGQHSFLKDPHSELVTNLKYATAIAWMVYRRCEQPLPEADDTTAIARYWYRHFHPKPIGTEKQFIRNYRELVEPEKALVA